MAGSNITTYRDIDIFEKEVNKKESIFYFFNKFNYFYNVLGFNYQYPYYSNDYYYDYSGYRSVRKEVNISAVWTGFYKKTIRFVRKWLNLS